MSSTMKAYIQANPSKFILIQDTAKGNLADFASLLTFIKLPMNQLITITEMKSNEWMNYGSLKEYEAYDNRRMEDRPDNTEDGGAMLTADLFNKINKSDKLSFELYTAMRNAELNRD